MSQYPRALYRMPGVEKLDYGLFTTKLAHDKAQLDADLADGWNFSQEEAKKAYEGAEKAQEQAEKKAAQEPGDADLNREELEHQAHKLGVEFSPNIGNKKLAERIAEKQAEHSSKT